MVWTHCVRAVLFEKENVFFFTCTKEIEEKDANINHPKCLMFVAHLRWMICIDRERRERSEKKVSKIYLFNILQAKCLLDCSKTEKKLENKRQPANNNGKIPCHVCVTSKQHKKKCQNVRKYYFNLLSLWLFIKTDLEITPTPWTCFCFVR